MSERMSYSSLSSASTTQLELLLKEAHEELIKAIDEPMGSSRKRDIQRLEKIIQEIDGALSAREYGLQCPLGSSCVPVIHRDYPRDEGACADEQV